MFGKAKPSVYLRKHLDEAGTGFELDDLMSRHEGDPAYQDVIEAVASLMRSYGDQSLSSHEARGDLNALAQKLETEGR